MEEREKDRKTDKPDEGDRERRERGSRQMGGERSHGTVVGTSSFLTHYTDPAVASRLLTPTDLMPHSCHLGLP